MIFTYRLVLAYDGSKFRGYAKQPGKRTVESTLYEALTPLVPTKLSLNVGGRTDRGVHATGQVVSFRIRNPLHEADVHDAIEAVMPGALAVRSFSRVPDWFHARWSAVARHYVYIHDDSAPVDVVRLDRMLFALSGKRCFHAYARDTPKGTNTTRTLSHASARALSGTAVRFDFKAQAFLRKQVRTMVSTAIREVRTPGDDNALVALAELRDRTATAPPAPPGGLFLTHVAYEPSPPNRSRSATRGKSIDPATSA